MHDGVKEYLVLAPRAVPGAGWAAEDGGQSKRRAVYGIAKTRQV